MIVLSSGKKRFILLLLVASKLVRRTLSAPRSAEVPTVCYRHRIYTFKSVILSGVSGLHVGRNFPKKQEMVNYETRNAEAVIR